MHTGAGEAGTLDLATWSSLAWMVDAGAAEGGAPELPSSSLEPERRVFANKGRDPVARSGSSAIIEPDSTQKEVNAVPLQFADQDHLVKMDPSDVEQAPEWAQKLYHNQQFLIRWCSDLDKYRKGHWAAIESIEKRLDALEARP